MSTNPDDKTIKNLLSEAKTVAVVGLSNKPHRDSYRVADYMQKQGYRIIPVNPRLKEVLGEKCYSDLLSVTEKVDIVNIFRRSEDVPDVVQEAISIMPRAIWMQLDIVNDEAAEMAVKRNITVIMDRCIKVEHSRLFKQVGDS